MTEQDTQWLLLKTGLSEKELAAIEQLAKDVINAFGAQEIACETWEDRWGGPELSVVKWFCVSGADVVDMSVALAEKKTEADTEALRSGRYHVGFVSASKSKRCNTDQ